MNILIIGLGSIGMKHVNAIRQLVGERRLYALRSSKDANSIEGVMNIFTLDELEVIPDFCLISNPTNMHKAAIEDCIQFNKPLFIEKPVFHTLDDIGELVEKLKAIPTYIACNLRFHPAIIFLKNLLAQNNAQINEVNIYCGSYLPEWRKGKDFRKTYSADPTLGGGVHLDLIHEIDYCCWLFGYPIDYDMYRTSTSTLTISASDYANCRLKYPHFTANITLNYYRRDSKRTIEIVMENDTLVVDLLANTIQNASGEKIHSGEFNILDTYKSQMQYFTKAIDDNQILMNQVEEAVNTLKIAVS